MRGGHDARHVAAYLTGRESCHQSRRVRLTAAECRNTSGNRVTDRGDRL